MKWLFKQISPCCARGTFNKLYYNHPSFDAEEKFDGDRRIGQFCIEGGFPCVRFTGRRVSDKDGLLVEKTTNVPHLSGLFDGTGDDPPEMCAPPATLEGTVLDGEMVCPWDGARSKDVTSIMGSAPAKAIAKQRKVGWLRWTVFDCLYFKGEDIRNLPLVKRREYLARVLDEWNNSNVVQAKVVKQDIEQFLHEVWERKGEGVILKDNGRPYGEQTTWIKVKKEFTVDCVVMGYEPPKQFSEKVDGTTSVTKYWEQGLIGAITVGQYKNGTLTECGSISGMTDAMRAEFTKNGKKYIGAVVEVEANEREEDTGRFRHPRFVQIRDNKDAKDCLWGLK